MTPYFIYALEVQSDGLEVDVWLNGLRVFREGGGQRRFSAKKLNPWLVDGPNEIEIRAARVGAPAPYLKVLVARTDGVRDEVAPEDVLVRYEWIPADQPLEEPPPQTVLAQRLDIGPAHGAWAWQSATPYVDADRPAVEAAVADLHAALGRRDVAGVVDRMRVKTDEMARALAASPSDLDGELREWLAELFQQSDWQMAPVDAAMLQIDPRAGGRLVTVTDVRGGAPLRGSGSESSFEPDELTYSHLAGGWTLVR